MKNRAKKDEIKYCLWIRDCIHSHSEMCNPKCKKYENK
jgi:hypothetical protein